MCTHMHTLHTCTNVPAGTQASASVCFTYGIVLTRACGEGHAVSSPVHRGHRGPSSWWRWLHAQSLPLLMRGVLVPGRCVCAHGCGGRGGLSAAPEAAVATWSPPSGAQEAWGKKLGQDRAGVATLQGGVALGTQAVQGGTGAQWPFPSREEHPLPPSPKGNNWSFPGWHCHTQGQAHQCDRRPWSAMPCRQASCTGKGLLGSPGYPSL